MLYFDQNKFNFDQSMFNLDQKKVQFWQTFSHSLEKWVKLTQKLICKIVSDHSLTQKGMYFFFSKVTCQYAYYFVRTASAIMQLSIFLESTHTPLQLLLMTIFF